MANVRIDIPNENIGGARVYIDGVDIAPTIKSLELNAGVSDMPTLTVQYLCRTVVADAGGMMVIHTCPLKGIVKGKEPEDV
jgi:hypothetical protein